MVSRPSWTGFRRLGRDRAVTGRPMPAPAPTPLNRPLVVIAALLAVMAAIGLAARLEPHGGAPPPASPVRTADLVMHDQPDGSIVVVTASGQPVTTIERNTGAFVRVVLSGLVQERRLEGEGSPAIPFHLTRWSDGRLTIDDIATGKLIELEAFGHTNEGAFARLLDLTPQPPAK
jgi:putative photosynthetic complex assembly protein